MKTYNHRKTICSWVSYSAVFFLVLFAFMQTEANAASTGLIRIAHTGTENGVYDPYQALCGTFKAVVERETGGRFTVKSFPNGQLGGVTPTLQQMERGLIEMQTATNTAYLASWYPGVEVLDIPYLFPSLDVARRVLNGPFGQYLSDRIAEKCGIKVLVWMPSAMRSFALNKEAKTPSDLKGVKIRVMETPVYIELVKSLGAIPTPIPWGELYTSLQTGVVGGHDQPPYIMRMFKFNEVNKHFLLDQHSLNSMALYMSNSFYKGLSPEDQKTMRHAARDAQLAMLGCVTAAEVDDMAWLANEGKVKIYSPTREEIQLYKKAAFEPVVKWLKTRIDPKLIDMLIKAVADAEKEK
jgi:tripartite ATP-independent transporter DctP family solute receptor